MASGSLRTSMPSILAQPKVGSCSVARTRIVDDLPAPLGPINPKTSPRGIVNEIPRTARTEPYLTHKLWISTIGTGLASAGTGVVSLGAGLAVLAADLSSLIGPPNRFSGSTGRGGE